MEHEISVETIVMELVVNGGNARSLALEAINMAAAGDFKLAEEKLKESEEALNQAHCFQTDLIQKEASGEGQAEVSLIMVHGQDHLMNAITVKELAAQMIKLYQRLEEEKSI